MSHAVPLKDCLLGLSKPFRKDFYQGRHYGSFCRPITWTHLVTHLVHIGTHRGLGRVLTGRAHRVY